jgi:hypothetical protein
MTWKRNDCAVEEDGGNGEEARKSKPLLALRAGIRFFYIIAQGMLAAIPARGPR